jgi:hypothetical protein
MDVVRRIFDAPLDPNKGDGVMKGQMLAAPVKIVTARRWEGVGSPCFRADACCRAGSGAVTVRAFFMLHLLNLR